MRNHSIALFNIDGAPLLGFSMTASGPRLTMRDSQDDVFAAAVDFYAPNEDAERLRRATEAFNEVMREPVAQAAE